MAIPVYTENTQRLNPLPRQRVQAADFGQEQIGRSVAQAGQAVMDFARQQDELDLRYDNAAAKRADTASLIEIADIKARYTALEGFDAVEARKKAEEEITAVRKKYETNLANDRQRGMFAEVFTRRIGSDLADIQRHETQQIAAAEKAEGAARAQGYIERAVNNYSNPEAFQADVATALGEVDALFPGAGAEVRRQKKAEVLSGIHVQVIDQLMTNPDNTLDAKDWADRHAGEILASDETKIRQKLQPALEEAQTDVYVGMVEELLATGRFDAGEGPEDDVEANPDDIRAPAEAKEARAEAAQATADPLRGKGRVSNTAAQHRERGSDNGLDIAAPAGTPIYPPMSGKVIRKWHDGANGYAVMVEHPNGYVTGYAHMRGESPLNVGDEVGAGTVIGSVGSTGKSTGPHLHYTVRRTADGPKVDPQAVKWEEGDLPLYRPERNDKAALYAAAHQVATSQNLSRRAYDNLLRQIDQRVAREDNLRARAIEDTSNRVWERIIELDEDFTRLDQIPEFASLLPADKQAVMRRLEQNQNGTEPDAYGADYLDLMEMSADPSRQREFMTIDLRKINTITKGERASLLRAQASMRGTDGTDGSGTDTDLAVDYSRINTAIKQFLPPEGFSLGIKDFGAKASEEDRRRQIKLTERVRGRAQRLQTELGRKLTDAELEGIVKGETITMTVTTPGRLWGQNTEEVPRYLADEIEGATTTTIQVPNAERDAIVDAYFRRTGRMPTTQEVTTLYLRGLGR